MAFAPVCAVGVPIQADGGLVRVVPKKLGFTSLLMILTIWIFYVHQMYPSPLLNYIRDFYQIHNNDALLNLAVSIMYPSIIVASLVGGSLERRVGTSMLFVLASLFVALGLVVNVFASDYLLFLMGRFLYGIGFGLGIPFMGSAIMSWYSGKQRYFMTTVNGLFPFLGTLIAFGLAVPLYTLLDQSIMLSFGVWALPVVLVIGIWLFLFRKSSCLPKDGEGTRNPDENRQTTQKPVQGGDGQPTQKHDSGEGGQASDTQEKSLYWGLLKRKNIRLLSIMFVCDYLCFSYLGIILPVYLFEFGGITESMAGLLAAVALPAVGIVGATFGGVLIGKVRRRKPIIIIGQVLQLFGAFIAALGSLVSLELVLFGVLLFALGDSMWMPAMYIVPTELKGMDSSKVAASYSLIMALGFVIGFIGPVAGGWLTNQFMLVSGILDPMASHVFGLRWSLFIFSFAVIIAFICSLRLTETGVEAKK